MSREILFRGKRTDNGEWVQGGYFEAPLSYFISETVWENEKKWSQWARAVDPSTVCQYTGLSDRNGVKIFENDIVRIAGYPDLYGWFIDFTRNNDYYRQDFGYWVRRITVIGNCFDNPELLEGEKECLSQD